MPTTKFEAEFRGFVEDFGGEIVPAEAGDGQQSADYFFRSHNVVAELKCLVVDKTDETFDRLSEIIDDRRLCPGSPPEEPGPDDIVLHCTGADGKRFAVSAERQRRDYPFPRRMELF